VKYTPIVVSVERYVEMVDTVALALAEEWECLEYEEDNEGNYVLTEDAQDRYDGYSENASQLLYQIGITKTVTPENKGPMLFHYWGISSGQKIKNKD